MNESFDEKLNRTRFGKNFNDVRALHVTKGTKN